MKPKPPEGIKRNCGLGLSNGAGWVSLVGLSLFMNVSPLFVLVFLAASIFTRADGPPVRVEKLARPPEVDGTGAGWPKGTLQTLTSVDGAAAFRLGYDAENFYALVEVADASPLKNSAGRVEELMKGGDAVGFYFGGPKGTEQRVMLAEREGKKVAYVYRPFSTKKQPYRFASPAGQADFDYVAPLPEARWATKSSAEGYRIEVALPWKSLGLKPPQKFPFDLQVIFSDPAGSTNVGSVWWFSNGGPGRTTEDLPTEAQLYPDTWGQAVLTDPVAQAALEPALAPAVTQSAVEINLNLPRAGRTSLVVRDENGWIVRELLRAEKREAGPQKITWDGRDRYGEPLPVGKYQWQAIVFDGMGSRFLGSVGSSGRPPYRTPDGLGAMGGQHGVEKSIAADAGGIYMAGGVEEGQPAMRKINPADGTAFWKRSAGAFGGVRAIATDDGQAVLINLSRRKGGGPELALVKFDPATGKDLPGTARIPLDLDKEARFGGLALLGGRAYFTLPEQNQLIAIDLASGVKLPPIDLPAPEGIVRLDAGHLLICSGKEVVKFDVAAGKSSPFIAGLEAPRAVTADPAGNVYVFDAGTVQQIQKFSAAGKLLETWGTLGGKPTNQLVYDPLAFKNITSMVVAADGNLWSAEASTPPRRFVKMSPAGKWLEDFYGPVAYNTFGPDLDDVSTVYYSSNAEGDPNFIKTHVDYEKYAANPLDPAAAWKVEAIYDLSRGADGVTVNPLMKAVAENGYGHVVAFTGSNGKKYFFRTSKGNRASQPPGAGIWIWEKNRWVPSVYLSRDEKAQPSWTDKNGDGLVQDDEWFTGLPVTSVIWLTRDLRLDGFEGTVKPASVDERGVPNYQGGEFAAYLPKGALSYQDGWTFASPLVNGAVFYVSNAGPERHLTFWDRTDENRLIKVENGRVQWVIGQHSEKADFAEFSTISGIAGIVDDLVLVHNVEPANYLAFTTDGFTLGNTIVDETGKRPSVGPNAINIENFTGLFIQDPKTGRRMLFSVSSGDDRILEITGPGELTRLEGEVALASVPPLQPMTATFEVPYQNWRGTVTRTQALDGIDAEWPAVKTGVPLIANGTVIGDVRLRRDGGKLAVFANLLDSQPLVEGEGLELTLATADGSQPQRFFIMPGVKKGKPAAVVQLNGTVIPNLDAKIVPRWNGLGHRIEGELPLELLPFAELREQTVRTPAKDPRTGKLSKLENKSQRVSDLPGEFQLSVAVVRQRDGKPPRVTWPESGAGTAVAP